MPDPSASYIAGQEAVLRRPTEIYRFWTDSGAINYLYTDGDIPITYGGSVYTPAPIKRTGLQADVTFDVSKITITVAYADDSVNTHINSVEGETIWIEVAQILRDMSPLEKQVVFIGQLSRPSFKGHTIQLECVGFEKFLSLIVPRFRFTPQCNHMLYDEGCGLDKADFVTSGISLLTVSTNGLNLTATEFGTQTYSLVRGFVKFGVHRRLIVSHSGTSISIRFAVPNMTAGSITDVYPGCTKVMSKCQELGNMGGVLDRFLGFRYIRTDNPVTWQ